MRSASRVVRLQDTVQTVRLTVDRDIRWDVDYVGLLIEEVTSHDVFLSHSWADKAVARRLDADLRANGVRVWLDEAEIKMGDSLIEKIGDAIDSVDYSSAIISDVRAIRVGEA